MLTRRGVAVLATAPVMYLFGRATAVGEILSVSVLAVTLPVAALIYVRLRRVRTKVERTMTPQRAFSGSRLEIAYAAPGLPAGVTLVDRLPAALGGTVAIEEAGVVSRTAGRRGRHDVPPVQAVLTDPFGLAWRESAAGPADQVVVYPHIEVAAGSPPGAREGGGPSLPSRDVTRGDDISGTRPYEDGDDARQIHWRTTARTGSLMVRKLEARLYPRATILLDDRATAYRGDRSGEAFERAVSFAASAVWSLLRIGTPVALATSSAGPGPARSGAAVTDDLLTALAVVSPTDTETLVPAIRSVGRASGGSLILIAPPGDIPAMLPHLRAIRRRYTFTAALLLDIGSFSRVLPSKKVAADRQLIEADHLLTSIGWRAAYAGANTRFSEAWTDLLPSASRPA